MASLAVSLSPFVQGVREFQQLGLVNKAIMDATAVDIPLITLSKNKTERKERFVRQALVLVCAFMIAPLHGRLISRLLSRGIPLPSKALRELAMQVPYRALAGSKQTAIALTKLLQQEKQLFNKDLQRAIKQRPEKLRRKILSAKTTFLMTDLVVCGLLMASIGYIKVAFGKLLSGNKQFSGEFGIVSESKLNQIYQQKKQKDWDKSTVKKAALTYGLAFCLPIATGLLIRHSFQKSATNSFAHFVKNKLAPWLDYNYPQYVKKLKGWPMLSDGSQIMLSILLTAGELTSARSKREFKELAIQRNAIDAMFFFGTPILMKALSGSTTVQGAINNVTSHSPKVIKAAASRAAKTYLASYVLASLGVAAVVTWTNNMTKAAVKADARKLVCA